MLDWLKICRGMISFRYGYDCLCKSVFGMEGEIMSYLSIDKFRCGHLNRLVRGAEVLVRFETYADRVDGVICSELDKETKVCSKTKKTCIVYDGFVRRTD